MLTLSSSTLLGNSASNGGAIDNGGTMTVSSSTLSSNSAHNGGATTNDGTMTISNSTLFGNSANGGDGGAIYNTEYGKLTVSGSTLSSNLTSNGTGGVLYNHTDGVSNLLSSIVAANRGTSPDISGFITSLGHNLVGNGTGSSGLINGVIGDQVGTAALPIDPKLGALTNNGGPTQTMALLSGSPALANGDCNGNSSVSPPAPVVTTDQRGMMRGGTPCDIGAYESGLYATNTPSFTPVLTPTATMSGTPTPAKIDTIGVYRSGIFYLRLYNKIYLTTGFSDNAEVLGNPGDIGVAGDWTGKGFDSPGIYRPIETTFYLSNVVASGINYADLTATYGSAGDLPIVGDWTGQGHDGIGMFKPGNGYVYLKNQVATGYADNSFFYGVAGDRPIAGHWQPVYPPVAPYVIAPSVLITRTPTPSNGQNSGSVPGGNQISG